MDPDRFDGLVRSFARPASRRGALGALAGGALGLLAGASPSAARRKHHHAPHRRKGGNSDCARFCADVFGADTSAADQCVSDGAHGKGLCTLDACQSQGQLDSGNACCVKTAGFCVNYADATCCSGNYLCGANGQCGCTPNCSAKCGGGDGCGGTCPNNCPIGADCFNNVCSCRHNPCTGDSSVCSTGFPTGEICNPDGTAVPRCCCSPSGNTLVACAPGPNAICCSGVCGDNNVCL